MIASRICGGVVLALAMILSLCVQAQESNVRYVNDVIHINLRVAPQGNAETIRVIPSGTWMIVLERDDESGFSRVRLESGEEGWVQHQFLTNRPIARDRLAETQSAAEQMQAERDRARTELARLQGERNELDTRLRVLEQQNQSLTAELAEIRATGAAALELAGRARDLEAGLQAERQQREAAEARAASAQTGLIMTGALAAVLGLAIGFYVGSMPVRREKRWRQVS